MTFVGNLLWFVFGGGVLAGTAWVLLGLLCCATVLGIPLGVACLRIASFAYFPFGKELVPVEWTGKERVAGTGIVNVLWCVLVGFWLSVWFALTGLAYCLSIVGIPFGLARFKLCVAAFAPLGKRAVSSRVAEELASRQVRVEADEIVKEKVDKKDFLLAVPVILFVALASAVVVRITNPALFVRTNEAVSFCESVECHQGFEMVAYNHRGEHPYEAIEVLPQTLCDNLHVIVFGKHVERTTQARPPMWRRMLNRFGLVLKKSGDAKGDVIVITDCDYNEKEGLRQGRYIYLDRLQSGCLKDKIAGLPIYLDEASRYGTRNHLLTTLQKSELRDLLCR